MFCYVSLCYVLFCFVMFCYVLLYLICFVMFCYVFLCFVRFWYVLLCFVIFDMFCYVLLYLICFVIFDMFCYVFYVLLDFVMFCYVLSFRSATREGSTLWGLLRKACWGRHFGLRRRRIQKTGEDCAVRELHDLYSLPISTCCVTNRKVTNKQWHTTWTL